MATIERRKNVRKVSESLIITLTDELKMIGIEKPQEVVVSIVLEDNNRYIKIEKVEENGKNQGDN